MRKAFSGFGCFQRRNDLSQRKGLLARIPKQALLCYLAMTAVQFFVFYATRPILPHLSLHILTGPLDARIPLSPPWVVIYCLSFPYWVVSKLWICAGERKQALRFSAAYILAMLLSCAVFLLWPGTMERPEITGKGFFDWWLGLVYRFDSPTNLCPSLHVLATYMLSRGAGESRHMPKWYAVFGFVFTFLVCLSVLFVKQHALIDIPVGFLIGELALQFAKRLRLERIADTLTQKYRKRKEE